MRSKRLWIAAAAWLLAVGALLYVLLDYEATETAHAAAPARYEHGAPRPVLLFFAHPLCPCTSASVTALEQIAARAHGRLTIRCYVVNAPHLGPEWHRASLWRRLQGIPEVAVEADPDGRTANRFGVRSSGHCLLYDRAGALRFSGGITPARGHEGDCDGLSAVLATARPAPAQPRQGSVCTPVYGCGLFEPEDA